MPRVGLVGSLDLGEIEGMFVWLDFLGGGLKESTKPSQLVGSGNRTAALVVVIATSLLASHTALQWCTPSG